MTIPDESESSSLESDERPREPQRPMGFRLPQIIVEGILRRSRRADIITFHLTLLRIIELTFIVTIPEEGKTRAPVYVRMFVNKNRGDAPGTVVIE